jgi:hypothetical protein
MVSAGIQPELPAGPGAGLTEQFGVLPHPAGRSAARIAATLNPTTRHGFLVGVAAHTSTFGSLAVLNVAAAVSTRRRAGSASSSKGA